MKKSIFVRFEVSQFISWEMFSFFIVLFWEIPRRIFKRIHTPQLWLMMEFLETTRVTNCSREIFFSFLLALEKCTLCSVAGEIFNVFVK